MPKIEENKLKRHIESEELYSVYVLYGQEKLTLKKSTEKLINKSKGNSFDEFNFNEFSNDSSIDDIADAALNLPFMAEKKCVAVYDYNIESKSSTEINKLNELLESLSDSTVLIFSYPTMLIDLKKSAKWRNFLKSAEKYGAAVAFEPKEKGDIVKYLMAQAEKNGSSVSKYNAEKIIEYAGNDLTGLTQEIRKISAYCSGREITEQDIEELITKTTETTVFLMVKAITAGYYDRAYGILDKLFYAKEDPNGIFAVLSKTYVDMYRVKIAIGSGKRNTAPMEYDNYKGREFILNNAQRDGNNISIETLRKSLDLLLETDMQLKGSKTNNRLILEELIAKLLLVTKGEK